jgi:hypothetical protein
VATKKRSRPLYEVFLERVIRIDAVQRHRAAVTDDFFSDGCLPGSFDDFRWSLDAPETFAWQRRETSVSLPMQHAWNAAVSAFKEFIKALKNGELIANGMYPATGVRYDLDPAEWTREWLILNVRNGDLVQVEARDRFDLAFGKKTVRSTTITLRVVKQPGKKKTRGHGYDWQGAWTYATSLRAEDQWDWKKYPRDKKQPLPAVHKVVEDKIKNWFEAKGNVPNIRDIRQNVIIPLYAGRRTRNNRKR